MKKFFLALFVTAIACTIFISCDPGVATVNSCSSHPVTFDQVADTTAFLSADSSNYLPVSFLRQSDLNNFLQSLPDSDYVGIHPLEGIDKKVYTLFEAFKPDGSRDPLVAACKVANALQNFDTATRRYALTDPSTWSGGPSCCPKPTCVPIDSVFVHTVEKL